MLLNFDGVPKSENNNEPQFNEEMGSYMSIESGFCVKKPKKYCDFTGFPCKYVHKNSGLRYTEEGHYRQIEKMALNKVENYLEIRRAVTVLK